MGLWYEEEMEGAGCIISVYKHSSWCDWMDIQTETYKPPVTSLVLIITIATFV